MFLVFLINWSSCYFKFCKICRNYKYLYLYKWTLLGIFWCSWYEVFDNDVKVLRIMEPMWDTSKSTDSECKYVWEHCSRCSKYPFELNQLQIPADSLSPLVDSFYTFHYVAAKSVCSISHQMFNGIKLIGLYTINFDTRFNEPSEDEWVNIKRVMVIILIQLKDCLNLFLLGALHGDTLCWHCW